MYIYILHIYICTYFVKSTYTYVHTHTNVVCYLSKTLDKSISKEPANTPRCPMAKSSIDCSYALAALGILITGNLTVKPGKG